METISSSPGGTKVSAYRWRVALTVVGLTLALWLFLPAFEGYHIGACNQTDYAVATAWAQANVGQEVGSDGGRVLTVTHLFQWCKPDENVGDYPAP